MLELDFTLHWERMSIHILNWTLSAVQKYVFFKCAYFMYPSWKKMQWPFFVPLSASNLYGTDFPWPTDTRTESLFIHIDLHSTNSIPKLNRKLSEVVRLMSLSLHLLLFLFIFLTIWMSCSNYNRTVSTLLYCLTEPQIDRLFE